MDKLSWRVDLIYTIGGITMKNRKNSNSKVNTDPSSSNYAKSVRNKSLENTPYGEDEPSTKTDYK